MISPIPKVVVLQPLLRLTPVAHYSDVVADLAPTRPLVQQLPWQVLWPGPLAVGAQSIVAEMILLDSHCRIDRTWKGVRVLRCTPIRDRTILYSQVLTQPVRLLVRCRRQDLPSMKTWPRVLVETNRLNHDLLSSCIQHLFTYWIDNQNPPSLHSLPIQIELP